MKLPAIPTMGLKLKIVTVVVLIAASHFAINEAVKFSNQKLDQFAVSRVESRALPITKTEVKVLVTDSEAVVDAAKQAAQTGAAEGANQAIDKALSGKR